MRLLFLLLLCAPAGLSWGVTGHRAVALIAQNHLSAEALAEIRDLLGDRSMADASTWADEIRALPVWSHSAPWHYVNVDDDQTYASSKKNPDGDVLIAIERLRQNLAPYRNSAVKRADALRFLIHFIGDMHQPLHVGRADDRGGNLIEVEWFGRPSNLHAVWDYNLLEQAGKTDVEWAAELDRADPEQARRWTESKPLDWANESFALRANVYAIDDGKLGQPYYDASLPIVRQRLLQAGLRLAAFLEDALR